MRRLIVNADDFGLTAGVNRGILEAHSRGIVMSATLMANGSAFADAIKLAQSAPGMSVGCHVVLVDGKPVLDGDEIAGLTGDRGEFEQSLAGFAARVLSARLEGEIEAEAIAQIRKLQAAGITVSHIDTHKHTHILPQVLRALLRAAKTCGVRAVRNPFGPVRLSQLLKYSHLWKRYAEVTLLQGLGRKFQRHVAQAGMLTTDGTVGVVETGSLAENCLQNIVDTLPEGTWELVCHPGYNDADLEAVRTRLRDSRICELQLLTSGTSRQLLDRGGIQLISYRDL